MKATLLTTEGLTELAAELPQPCLSLYLPTHRHHPANQQDPIHFRRLVQKLEQLLQPTSSPDQVSALLQPMVALSNDRAFWNHTRDGLAAFGAPGFFRVFGLSRPVRELAVVADSFHTKPLRRFLQSTDRFQILGLSRHEIKLFEGNRDGLEVVGLAPGVPRTVTEALGEELSEPHLTVASYGGVGGASTSMHHGHGGKKDEVDIDADRFFRAIDRAVLEFHSRPSGLPLILAALPEHHHLFRAVSHNPFLIAEGIDIHPDALPLDGLRERAWKIFEPEQQAQLAALADDFAVAKSKHRGLDDLAQVSEAAAAGRVATLLIEADRTIAGRIAADTGRVQRPDSADEAGDDLLDDLGELVLKLGGRVVVVPSGRMPAKTGAAAILRF